MSVSTRLSMVLATLSLVAVSAAAQAQSEVAQAAGCRPCRIAQESCTVNCLGRGDKKEIGACLIACDNAAALCSCDEPATLTADAYLALIGRAGVTTSNPSCNPTTACPPEYAACTNWSPYSDCDAQFCGITIGCGECNEWGQCEAGGPGLKQRMERYKVCFNPQGQSCTQYQRTTTSGGCGC